MEPFELSGRNINEAYQELKTSAQGLTTKEAQKRQTIYGLNTISIKGVSGLQIFLRQFHSPFTYILAAAVLISVAVKQFTDAWLIAVFIAVNVALGFYMEYKSHRTQQLLAKHLAPKAKVLRDGKWEEIDAQLLVPGDIIEISVGNVVAADARLTKAENLTVDESALTGESQPVVKILEVKTKIKEIFEARNMVFASTAISSGKGLGVVTATGTSTSFGSTAKLAAQGTRESVFETEITSFSRALLGLVVAATFFVFLANLLQKGGSNPLELALFSIALAVSVIPEALPVVVAFSFSQGALVLAKDKVVVKRLAAIEDLGSIEILCTDKTGTITENHLAATDVYKLDGDPVATAFQTIEKSEHVDSFETALIEASKETKNPAKILEKIPFDAQKRYDMTTIKAASGAKEIVIKGAPEAILALSSQSSQKKKDILSWLETRGREGKRVLGIGTGTPGANNFAFVGMVAFSDPIKKTSADAVERAQRLGVEIKILSGDRPEVSQEVAAAINLIKSSSQVMTGETFENLSDQKKQKAVEDIIVFARVTPEQKYEIIKLLQEKDGKTVGYLGDGINDAPALKLANVAMAVEGSTDVAREAADIFFLHKDLDVIVSGIREGRKIFANTNKYITATLSANFGNFLAIALASLLIDYLPMLPIQILLVNLLSDFPMIAMATDHVDEAELKHPSRWDLKSSLSLAGTLGSVSTVFDFMFFLIFRGFGKIILQTGWFIESILTELVFIYSARTKKLFFQSKGPSLLLGSLTLIAAITTIAVTIPSVTRKAFEFAALSPSRLGLIGIIVLAYFAATELAKYWYFKRS